MIARTLKTPGDAVKPMTRNAWLKSALVVGSGMSFVPIRTISSVHRAYPMRFATSAIAPANAPRRQMLPMSDARPAITMTVTA